VPGEQCGPDGIMPIDENIRFHPYHVPDHPFGGETAPVHARLDTFNYYSSTSIVLRCFHIRLRSRAYDYNSTLSVRFLFLAVGNGVSVTAAMPGRPSGRFDTNQEP
jgi:hypothetical protein